jgi:hypothetical protein
MYERCYAAPMPEFLESSRPARGVISNDAIPTVVFLTVCTRGRGRWLADDRVPRLAATNLVGGGQMERRTIYSDARSPPPFRTAGS